MIGRLLHKDMLRRMRNPGGFVLLLVMPLLFALLIGLAFGPSGGGERRIRITLLFEDRDGSIASKMQEMLRIEKIFEEAAIQEELDAYNPLIPDGDNLKATMLIEYEDVAERQLALNKLKDIEHHIYAQIGEQKIYAIADEDLERSNDEKTASVHFLRFQFDGGLVRLLRNGADFSFGCDHAEYLAIAPLTSEQRKALSEDFL